MDLKKLVTPFKVGLLVLVAIAATLYMLTTLSEGPLGGREGYTVYAMFDDVTGLAVNSRVMMSGIPVGSLESIELQGRQVRVEIAINKDLTLYKGQEPDAPGRPWKNGATVVRKQASFLGDYFLELSPGTEGPVLEDGDQIMNVAQTVGPEQIFDKLDEITTDISQITEQLAEVFGTEAGRKSLQEILDDLRSMLDTIDNFVEGNAGKVDRILGNAEAISTDVREFTRTGTESLSSMIRDAEAVVQEVKFIIGQSSTDVQAGLGTLRGTLARLQSTLDSLNYSLQNIQDITDKVNEGEGTVGQLVNSPTIANRTEQILNDAGDFVGRISKLKTIVELRTEYHTQAQQFKNIFGLRLQPELEKYYLVEFVDDFRGTTEVSTRAVNTTYSGSADGQFVVTERETTEDFKFSIEIARGLQVNDWLMFYGRFGLIESSGGLGGDILLTEGYDLEIKTDIFDFGVDRNPRLRSFALYRFFEFAYIAAGVDDALNDDRRDYFIGAGIRFDDEDLKAIISTTGVPSGG